MERFQYQHQKKIEKSVFGANLPLKPFPATVANVDIGSLKSLHTFLKNVCTTCQINLNKIVWSKIYKILSCLTKNRVCKSHFWQSADAILEDVCVAETIICLILKYQFSDYIIFQCSKNYYSPTCVTRLKLAPNMAEPISLKGCGMGPRLVLVSPCFRENAVATCKIGSFLCSLDNLLQKNAIVFFFLNQISKWRSFKKKKNFFDLLFTFLVTKEKLQKFLQHISHSHTYTYFAQPIDFFWPYLTHVGKSCFVSHKTDAVNQLCVSLV